MSGFLIDIDGTTLLGREALPGARAFVEALRARGTPFLWVTNNTSRTRTAWLERLAAAGFAPDDRELYTAADATLDHLRALDPTPRIHLVGTAALAAEFRAAGVEVVDGEPDAVVLAYDTELTYAKLARASHHIRAGLPYFATHPDRTCPTPAGPIPDVGSFIALFESACGRRPQVLGKPSPAMMAGACARLGVAPADAVMIGDRLETDIQMAQDAGARSWLVLTGVTRREDVGASASPPTQVLDSLAGAPLP